MTDLTRTMLGFFGLSPEDKKILDSINRSGLKTMRVVGRGTLMVDAKEVTNTHQFKDYSKKAEQILKSY